jgi:hypothetical protein
MNSSAARLVEYSEATQRSQKSTEYLSSLCMTGAVVPFVGAGLSIPYGLPGWTAFLIYLSDEANIREKITSRLQDGQFEEAVDDILREMGARSLQRRSVLDPSEVAILSEGNALLSGYVLSSFGLQQTQALKVRGVLRLLPKLADGPVVTTNFDRILEVAYESARVPFMDKLWGDHVALVESSLRERRRVLLKLHGDAEDKQHRVLSLKEYEDFYGSTNPAQIDWDLPLPKALNYLFRSTTLLFIGCSLTNDRTVEALRQVHSSHGPLQHFAILEWPESEKAYRKAMSSLSQAGIRPIWYPRGRHDQISDILKRLSPPAPRAAYAFAIAVVLALAVLFFSVNKAYHAPSKPTEEAEVDDISVISAIGHSLRVNVHYKYQGDDRGTMIKIEALGPKNGAKSHTRLFSGVFSAASGNAGMDRSGWIFQGNDFTVESIRACVGREEHVSPAERPGNSYYGDDTFWREVGKCNEVPYSITLSGRSNVRVLSVKRLPQGISTITVAWSYAWESGPSELRVVADSGGRNPSVQPSTVKIDRESLPDSIEIQNVLTLEVPDPPGASANPNEQPKRGTDSPSGRVSILDNRGRIIASTTYGENGNQ